jgi:hypothetical protein
VRSKYDIVAMLPQVRYGALHPLTGSTDRPRPGGRKVEVCDAEIKGSLYQRPVDSGFSLVVCTAWQANGNGRYVKTAESTTPVDHRRMP